MTENKIEKLNGKRVKFIKHAFPHSVEQNEFTGTIHIDHDDVVTPRNGVSIHKTHVGFYLDSDDGKTTMYFDYRAIKLITRLEVLEDE